MGQKEARQAGKRCSPEFVSLWWRGELTDGTNSPPVKVERVKVLHFQVDGRQGELLGRGEGCSSVRMHLTDVND